MPALAVPLALPLDNACPRRWWAGDIDRHRPGRPGHAGLEDQMDGFAVVIELRDAQELARVRDHLPRLLGRGLGEGA